MFGNTISYNFSFATAQEIQEYDSCFEKRWLWRHTYEVKRNQFSYNVKWMILTSTPCAHRTNKLFSLWRFQQLVQARFVCALPREAMASPIFTKLDGTDESDVDHPSSSEKGGDSETESSSSKSVERMTLLEYGEKVRSAASPQHGNEVLLPIAVPCSLFLRKRNGIIVERRHSVLWWSS